LRENTNEMNASSVTKSYCCACQIKIAAASASGAHRAIARHGPAPGAARATGSEASDDTARASLAARGDASQALARNRVADARAARSLC
jgi:hypothetical protein